MLLLLIMIITDSVKKYLPPIRCCLKVGKLFPVVGDYKNKYHRVVNQTVLLNVSVNFIYRKATISSRTSS